MTQVTFYVLDKEDQQHPAHWQVACQLAAQCYRNKQRCVVLCEDQGKAESFDELLWQQPTDAFVPHNLTGEGPVNGTPVQIAWQSASSSGRAVLINLTDTMPQQSHTFKRIIDFVPVAEQQKHVARQRYKHYRAAGFSLTTEAASSINETING